MNNQQKTRSFGQAWFIPGRFGAPDGPLARYRPIQSVQAVEGYVRALTQPGDLVVDLFCQGPTIVRETVGAGRRALGFSVNPLLLAATHLGLDRCDTAALNAAFTHLVDNPKGDVPLRHYLASLYRSTCPACDAQGVAEWFAWDRDGNYPFEKAVRCARCGEVQEGATNDEDVAFARGIQPRGLAYYYALDRVAPPGHARRERAAQLVEIYTSRNLSALMDLTMRLEGLKASEDVILALTGVLLDCFDAGSSLDPYNEERPRPRTLRIPSRYIERNVWLHFEETFSHFVEEEMPPPVQQATDVAALVRGETEGYALVSHAARDVRRTIPAGSASLIFADPPRPDGVFWALSALWAGWLWDSPSARTMRPFLSRRRFDWDWHLRVLQAALKAAGPLLTNEGYLITMFYDPDDSLPESVCTAACSAGYTLEGWGYSPGVGYRLAWRWEGQNAGHKTQDDAADDAEAWEREVMTVAVEAVVDALRRRGEPTGWALLHGSVCARLAERGLPTRAAIVHNGSLPDSGSVFSLTANAIERAFEVAPLVQVTGWDATDETLWWLADAGHTAEPLADRVGALVLELLIQRPVWQTEELVNVVYAHFSGDLTPDLALILVCIDSYSVQKADTLRLRPEDDSLRRAAELTMLRDDLAELGTRLGFEVSRRGGWDVRWLEEERETYVFDVSAMVALERHLLIKRTVDEGAQRCLVVPGGRAALVSFKLQRDPRLTQAVQADGWQFIKFRHLRQLVAKDDLDSHALKTVLGLDPIVEQAAVQIPLF
ncbi:MAG: hypothetical protein GY832_03990 [Chloroflexi bacterium]|nr:hypothetical protein [Chloroflexota bacterium]